MAERGIVLLLFVALFATAAPEDYHPERTRLMDFFPRDSTSSPTNFLFRGNMPVVNGSFAYRQVVSTMADLIKLAGFTIPQNSLFIDFSYLNVFEFKDLEIERKFFESNRTLGEFLNRVVTGTEILAPASNSCIAIQELLRVYEDDLSWDDLPKLTARLRNMLTQRRDRPALIYTHCEAGTDRTGEVSGAYDLRYLNQTFQEAWTEGYCIQNRPMYKTSRNALQLYCHHLHCNEGFTHLNCTVPSKTPHC